jgi:hypothetical protein
MGVKNNNYISRIINGCGSQQKRVIKIMQKIFKTKNHEQSGK